MSRPSREDIARALERHAMKVYGWDDESHRIWWEEDARNKNKGERYEQADLILSMIAGPGLHIRMTKGRDSRGQMRAWIEEQGWEEGWEWSVDMSFEEDANGNDLTILTFWFADLTKATLFKMRWADFL